MVLVIRAWYKTGCWCNVRRRRVFNRSLFIAVVVDCAAIEVYPHSNADGGL